MAPQQQDLMHQQIEELWKNAGSPATLDGFRKQFFEFQFEHDIPFSECLTNFRFKRKHEDDAAVEEDPEDVDTFVDYVLSINTIDLLLLSVHNAMAGMSTTNLKNLWAVVIDSDHRPLDSRPKQLKKDEDDDSSDEDDENDDEPLEYENYRKFKETLLTFDQLDVIRALLSGARRGVLQLSKLTVVHVFANISDGHTSN